MTMRLKCFFSLITQIFCLFNIGAAVKFQSSNAEIDFSNSNAKLTLQSSMYNVGGILSLRDLSTSSIVLSSTMNNIYFSSGYLNSKSTFNPYAETIDPNNSYQRLVLTSDTSIGNSDLAWNFSSNAVIDGNGSVLTISKPQGITITGTSKTLTFKDVRLVTTRVDAIACLTDTCTLRFEGNTEWQIAGQGFLFSTGSIIIEDRVVWIGDNFSTQTFEFTSKGTLTILNNSELVLVNGLFLKMNANPSSDANFNATKRHLVLNNTNSSLVLQGATLVTTDTGVAIDRGEIRIAETSTVKTTSNSYAKFEVGQMVNLVVLGGSKFLVDGIWQHTENTFLLYGDSTSLQHNSYGFYLGSTTDTFYSYGLATLDNSATKWYIEPGDQGTRFGNKSGQFVRSGDFVRFECKFSNGTTPSILQVFFLVYLGAMTGPPVSTPIPPYYRVTAYNNGGYMVDNFAYLNASNSLVTLHNSCQLFRLYKVGGTVGDPIMLNDLVYFYSYPLCEVYWSATPSYNISKKYYYIGSSNQTYNSNKEIFAYQITSTTQPGNLASNLTWKVTDIKTSDYLSAATTNFTYNYTDLAISGTTALWPDASLTQY